MSHVARIREPWRLHFRRCGLRRGRLRPRIPALAERIFPEPDFKLRLLPPEHPIWSAEEPVDAKYQRPLWGIDLGCRTCVAYCPENLSCYWELARPTRDKKYPTEIEARVEAAKKIGVNVLAYATNRDPKYKLDLPQLVGVGSREAFERAKVYVATVKHTGGAIWPRWLCPICCDICPESWAFA